MSSILVLGYNVNMSEKSIDTNTLWLLWEFVSAIKENTQPIVNEIDGFRAMEVAHQILFKINNNLSTS